MEFFSSISPILIWFVVGAILFLAEMLTPNFVLFFFGIGAWCVALARFFIPIELSIQLLIFLSTSFFSLFLLRSTLKKVFLGERREKYVLENEIPGGITGIVVEDIVPPATGQVKYGGSFWTASAEQQIAAGTKVSILKQQNLTVTVAPLITEGKEKRV